MPGKAETTEGSFSRFFLSGKKRPSIEVNIKCIGKDASDCPSRLLGTKSEPLELSDDSDDENDTTEIATMEPVAIPESPARSLKQANPAHPPLSPVQSTAGSDDETKQGRVELEQPKATSVNRFTAFAFKDAEGSPKKHKLLTQWVAPPAEKKIKAAPKKVSSSSRNNKENEWVKINDLPKEEQERIRKKWHSMADPSAPLEVRRFQVLVAARLHARCQEPTVRKAMTALRQALPELSAEELAKADPEVLANVINNIQFFNAKAKQIVKAAQEILSQFSGAVPEDEYSLLKITGVGKVFADLLANVNSRSAYAESASS